MGRTKNKISSVKFNNLSMPADKDEDSKKGETQELKKDF